MHHFPEYGRLGDGIFSKPKVVYTNSKATQFVQTMAVLDINGDGRLDIVAGA